jgi:hypothetical protein
MKAGTKNAAATSVHTGMYTVELIPIPENVSHARRSIAVPFSIIVGVSPPEPRTLKAPASCDTRRSAASPSRSSTVVIWVTSRRRSGETLTATPDAENDPRFSPDGSDRILAAVGNNTDVYVVGRWRARRLTYHPGSIVRMGAG